MCLDPMVVLPRAISCGRASTPQHLLLVVVSLYITERAYLSTTRAQLRASTLSGLLHVLRSGYPLVSGVDTGQYLRHYLGSGYLTCLWRHVMCLDPMVVLPRDLTHLDTGWCVWW